MRRKIRNRLIKLSLILGPCLIGAYLIISNLNENIIFFYPPSEINNITTTKNKIRIGGIVEENSVQEIALNKISFYLIDQHTSIRVEYEGLLPGLFREKQGIIAEGKLIAKKNLLIANKLLVKHDENYYPAKKTPKKPFKSNIIN